MSAATPDHTDADALRDRLMSPEPMQRFSALHALEREAAARSPRLASEVEKFSSRGVPFYSPEDAHYRSWVARAVDYWERVHGGPMVKEAAAQRH